ncbi:MAG: inositol monophosphatase family protein [Candidatus Jordarchaeum sp.]|uniref:inositol monophosphatase family protein n=1 Tax=Candidatus Jordarchaeum sp. TaxID=2823881 RepID=UPI0040490848
MENKDYLKLLLDIVEKAQVKLLKEGKGTNEILGYNIKGDTTRGFDKTTEDYLMNEIRKIYKNITFLAEEAGVVEEGKDIYVIIDPCDGSSNFSRGIGVSAIAIAVAPSPFFEEVEIAVVKDIVSGKAYYAIRGGGAFLDGVRVIPSKIKELSEAIVGIDLDFPVKSDLDRVIPILKTAQKVRKIGSNSLELSYVSSGGYDAFVDVRSTLSAENFASARLIIEEAGGLISDDEGNSIVGEIDLTRKQNLVAAGNSVLHEKILELLQ